MVHLDETDDEVEKIRKGQLAHVCVEFVEDPVKVDLDALAEGVVADRDSQRLDRLQG